MGLQVGLALVSSPERLRVETDQAMPGGLGFARAYLRLETFNPGNHQRSDAGENWEAELPHLHVQSAITCTQPLLPLLRSFFESGSKSKCLAR
jgi:hypothetical protein